VRSISLPVQECSSHPWPDFLRLLHGAWRQSTDLSNWASQTLARHDAVRTPAMTELPPYSPPDLYALAFGRAKEGLGRQMHGCPECRRKWHPAQLDAGRVPAHDRGKGPCPGSGRGAASLARKVLPAVAAQFAGFGGGRIAAAGLLRRVQAKYLRERGKVVWRRERRTPEYLYPVPFPVHPQAWAAWWGDPESRRRPHVSLALPGGRVSLRLRNGPEFAAALKVFAAVVDGGAAQHELSLCRQRSSAHARTDSQRAPGGAHRETYRVMVRIAYRTEAAAAAGGVTAFARTGRDPFLTLAVPGVRECVLHAPWARQWIARHRKFLDDFSDDLKFEKRWPAHKRRALNRYRERLCVKQARRMRTFLQQTAAQAVGWAARQSAGRLALDLTDRSFAAPVTLPAPAWARAAAQAAGLPPELIEPSFPWSGLVMACQHKCDECGVTLSVIGPASAEAVEVNGDAGTAAGPMAPTGYDKNN
jgi:hypothetical protein